MAAKTKPYEELKQRSLQDPNVRAAYDALEPAYQVARLRIMRGLTQKELADLVGTKQPSIARLESGSDLPRLSFLRRVVEALGGRVIITIEADPETATAVDAGAIQPRSLAENPAKSV